MIFYGIHILSIPKFQCSSNLCVGEARCFLKEEFLVDWLVCEPFFNIGKVLVGHVGFVNKCV